VYDVCKFLLAATCLSCTVSEIFYVEKWRALEIGLRRVEGIEQEFMVMNKDFQLFAFDRTPLLPQ